MKTNLITKAIFATAAYIFSSTVSPLLAQEADDSQPEYVAGQVNAKTKIKNKNKAKSELKELNMMGFANTSSTNENSPKEDEDIYFSADEMINDDENQTITAVGNVNIMKKNTVVIADKVTYNRQTDKINANGNVIMMNENGDVIFSDDVELTDKMSQGTMHQVKVVMADETKITAKRFRRLGKDNKVMDSATYTPCDSCEDSNPLWQLHARKVKHYAESKNMVYNDAYLTFKGIPVFYTPYLSHPDPTVKKRSGFLFPSIGSTKYLGQYITPQYYWAIDDHQDFLFMPTFSADRDIMWGGQYRKYFERGYINLKGTYLNGAIRNNDYEARKLPEFGEKRDRGNIYLNSRYEINDEWVAKTDINYVSDRYYLKDISLPQKDDMWLTSFAGAERFNNRDYASVGAYYYKFISYMNLPRSEERPYVLPLASYEKISEPNIYGMYTKTTLDYASVLREETNSSQRMTMINAWNLPYTSPYGEKYKLVASVKSDLYYVDKYHNSYNQNFTGSVGRVFPQVGLEWRLPFIKATESSRQIIEPVIVAVAAPNGGNKDDKIPNEDSQDIQFNDANILSLDRYPGYDRNDTGSRISYGFNWNSYGEVTGHTAAFVGQSYRFKKNEGFGEYLDQRSYFSDYVGRINATPNEYLDLNYRFTIDKSNYKINYSELTAGIGPQMLKLFVSYIYLQNNPNAMLQGYEERQELYTSLHLGLTRDWSLNIYNRQDLANTSRSLEYGGAAIYEDECFKFILNLRRYNYVNSDYDDDFEYTATLMFKTLGTVGQ